MANLYTLTPLVAMPPPYAMPISTTKGNPEYADADLCTTAQKSGSKNFCMPLSSGSAPSGARHVGSGGRNSPYLCSESLSFTSSLLESRPTLFSGLNPANAANFAAVVGPTRWNLLVRNAESVSPAAMSSSGLKWSPAASTSVVTVSDAAKSLYVTAPLATSMSSTRILESRSGPMPSRAASETIARRSCLSGFFLPAAFLTTASAVMSDALLNPRAARRASAAASSTAGTDAAFSAIIRRMVSTSTPNGWGRMTVGAGGIDFMIRWYRYRFPFGSSKVMAAYGVISDVWYT